MLVPVPSTWGSRFNALKGQNLRGQPGREVSLSHASLIHLVMGMGAASGCRCLCGDHRPGSSVPASSLGFSPAIYAQLPCGAQGLFPRPSPSPPPPAVLSGNQTIDRQRTGAKTTCPPVHPASWRRRNLSHDQGETILKCPFKGLGLEVRLSGFESLPKGDKFLQPL